MSVIFSSDYGATAKGTIDPTRWDVARNKMSASFQSAKNQSRGLIASARSKLTNVRNTLATGPINNWALNRAFQDPTSYIRGGAGSKQLARLAGRRSLYNRVFSGPAHASGLNWTKDLFGMGPAGVAGSGFTRAGGLAKHSLLGRVAGPAYLAYAGYEGYKKEGVWGAAKGIGTAAIETYMIGRLFASPAGPIALAALATAATVEGMGRFIRDPEAFGGMKGWVRPWTSEYHKKTKSVQMGGEIVDPHGMNATMRQRSLLAIQNSRLNARSGIGHEAAMTYSPYFA